MNTWGSSREAPHHPRRHAETPQYLTGGCSSPARATNQALHKNKSTWKCLLASPVWDLGSLMCLAQKTRRLVERRGLGFGNWACRLSLAFCLPTALPLMNGYSSYEQHHSGYSQMVISFFYGGRLVGRITTSCSEGCRLSLSQPSSHGEKLYAPDALEHVRFPSADAIQNDRQKQITKKLFGHLERGVLLHSNKQGIFIKRLCQGRVFWSGNTMIYKDRPNKLDRDEVVKIFDTSSFFRELQQYYNNQGRFPDSRVMLCFGEEFPDAVPLRCKLILVQVEQLCVRQVVEEAGKTCSSSPMLPIADETQHDQVYRIFQDICATHQRPLFRENQQIAV
ncbi:interferon regulatory factor 8 isoform 6-T7 [Amazona ochrocephala]